jgi:hypothetical protein
MEMPNWAGGLGPGRAKRKQKAESRNWENMDVCQYVSARRPLRLLEARHYVPYQSRPFAIHNSILTILHSALAKKKDEGKLSWIKVD